MRWSSVVTTRRNGVELGRVKLARCERHGQPPERFGPEPTSGEASAGDGTSDDRASEVSRSRTDGQPRGRAVAAAGRGRACGTEQPEQPIAGLKSRLTGRLQNKLENARLK